MKNGLRRILKSGEVKVQGTYKIDIGPSGSGQVPSAVPQQVQVVEKYPDYAIIEFVCSCGAASRVRCDYGEAPAAEQETSETEK